jgi:hypothetical protein
LPFYRQLFAGVAALLEKIAPMDFSGPATDLE